MKASLIILCCALSCVSVLAKNRIVVPKPRKAIPLKLEWDYPNMNHHIVFEVWWNDHLSDTGWTLMQTTTNTSVRWDAADAPAKFFRVRAKDTRSRLVSEWASIRP